jgi:hypothetical protein
MGCGGDPPSPITAVEETELLGLDRADFLDAVTGQIDATSAA